MSLITGAITLPAQAVSGEPLAGFVGIAINGSDQLVIVNSAGAVGTFALTFGKTLTVTNSLTLTGTDGASVNLDRLANLATGKVLGRTTAGTGAVEALSISGTGSVAMTTSPSFTTPSLGAATAASINGERIGSASSGSRYFSTQGGNAYANLEGNAPGFGFIDTSATLGTNGGYIKTAGGTSGAGGNIDTSGSGSAAGGSINTTAGGSITTGTGGYINTGTNGPIATGTNGPIATGTGGYINTGTGGYINTGTGGYIDTSTGFIVLGDDGVNRTALISLTGANRTINLPDTGGVTKTLAVTTDITGGTLAGSFTTLALPTSSTAVGMLTINGVRVLHSYNGTSGSNNFFIGPGSGNFQSGGAAHTSAQGNFGAGIGAMANLTTGGFNYGGMAAITTGSYNTSFGYGALQSITTQDSTTGIGKFAGQNCTGYNCTFVGTAAGATATGGTGVSVLGMEADVAAGSSYSYAFGSRAKATGGDYCGAIGSYVQNTEANTMAVGRDGTQSAASGTRDVVKVPKLKIGNGSAGGATAIDAVLSASILIGTDVANPGTVPAGGTLDTAEIAMLGLAANDNLMVGLPASPLADVIVTAYCSSAGNFKLRFQNISAAGIAVSALTYRVTSIQF